VSPLSERSEREEGPPRDGFSPEKAPQVENQTAVPQLAGEHSCGDGVSAISLTAAKEGPCGLEGVWPKAVPFLKCSRFTTTRRKHLTLTFEFGSGLYVDSSIRLSTCKPSTLDLKGFSSSPR
jgi:hypothetical protein